MTNGQVCEMQRAQTARMSAENHTWYELPESRMKGNFHVRFGGGRLEKGQQCHLASRLPNTEWDRSATTLLLPSGAP